MRILHTSDWHIGKNLGRYDRSAEFIEVLDEVQGIAEAREVDLVIVSGDVWDRGTPPTDALGMGIEALVRLAAGGKRQVVAIAGNHDSQELFEVLAPPVRPFGVHTHQTPKMESIPPKVSGWAVCQNSSCACTRAVSAPANQPMVRSPHQRPAIATIAATMAKSPATSMRRIPHSPEPESSRPSA